MEKENLLTGETKKNKKYIKVAIVVIIVVVCVALIIGLAVGLTKKSNSPSPPSPVITPTIITTWNFINATQTGFQVLMNANSSALDAIEAAGNYCEMNPGECDFSVGYGGSKLMIDF